MSCFSNDWLPCLVEKSEMWNFYVSYFIKCLNVKLLSKLKPLATKFVNWHFEISVVQVCTSIFEGGRILFLKIEWIKHVHLASLAMSSIAAPTLNYLCQLPCSVAFVQKIVCMNICGEGPESDWSLSFSLKFSGYFIHKDAHSWLSLNPDCCMHFFYNLSVPYHYFFER